MALRHLWVGILPIEPMTLRNNLNLIEVKKIHCIAYTTSQFSAQEIFIHPIPVIVTP